jgi:RNA polymerase sigma factor (sigma-70 family)
MATERRGGRTARASAGDEALVQAVYREHGRAMLAYATRLLNDRAAAEDVVQEALIRAWRHPEVLTNGKGSIRGWLLTVVRNLVTDRQRARAARPAEVAETAATGDLSAVVRATPLPTPSLEFSHAAAGFARTARFEFLDGEEVIHGDLVLRFVFQAGQLDHFSLVYVRERTSSARQFLTLSLAPDGRIVANDESGDPAIEIGTYLPGIDYLVQVVFHMDEHSWDLDLDGVPIVTGRVHGIEDRGIGAVLFGTDHQTDPGSVLLIDRLRVRRGDAIFTDGFDQAPAPVEAT